MEDTTQRCGGKWKISAEPCDEGELSERGNQGEKTTSHKGKATLQGRLTQSEAPGVFQGAE